MPHFRFVPILVLASLLAASRAASAQRAGDTRGQIEQMKLDQEKRRLDKGQQGKIAANCDDVFELYVNDRLLLSGGWPHTPKAHSVTLRPGDVITVKAVNKDGPSGFAMAYRSNSRKAEFSTNLDSWFLYEPADEQRWWVVTDYDALEKTPVKKATNQGFKGSVQEAVDVLCRDAIWGEADKPTVYLIRRIGYDDLME